MRIPLTLCLIALILVFSPCVRALTPPGKTPSTVAPTSNPYISEIETELNFNRSFSQTALFQAAATFVEDGKTYVVIGDNSANEPTQVLSSNGDGTFTFTANLPPSFALAVGDLNNDRHFDLIGLASFANSDFWIALGNGDGTFQPPVFYDTYCDANKISLLPGTTADFLSVTIADFNGDGKADWIVLCSVPTLYFGDGMGGFTSSQKVGGTGPIVLGDFNGDGIADYAARGDGGTVVYLGSHTGKFQGSAVLQSVAPVLEGDFNGDGEQDLVTQPLQGKASIIYWGNGDGTFVPGPQLSTSVVGGVVADFNRDGHLDIGLLTQPLIGSFDSVILASNPMVLLGRGDGTFSAGPVYFGGQSPQGLLAADLKGDGQIDLVAISPESSPSYSASVGVLFGNGDGTFEAPSVVLNTGVEYVAAGDFNNDNKLDFVAAKLGTLSMVLGNGDGTFQSPLDSPTGAVSALAAGDFNNDGNLDVVAEVGAGNSTRIDLYLGSGDGNLRLFSSCQCGSGAATQQGNVTAAPSIGVADFNDDGNADLAISNPSANTVSINFGDGKGHFTPGPVLQLGDLILLAATGIGDIIHKGGNDTHKGGNDFVSGGCLSGDCIVDGMASGSTNVFLNSGNGEFSSNPNSSTLFPRALGVSPITIAVGDFNQDGKADLVVGASDLSDDFLSLFLLLGNGDGTFQPPQSIVGDRGRQVLATDVNLDGKLDLITIGGGHYPNDTVFDGRITVLLGAGDGTFGQPTFECLPNSGCVFAGQAAQSGVIGDFNGDGAPDFLEGQAILHLNSGGTYIQPSASPNPAPEGATITLSANVAASYHGVLMPQATGAVSFYDLSVFPVATLATSLLVNGNAVATISGLSPGIHVIEPIYSGDSNFHQHIGAAVNLQITSTNSGSKSSGATMTAQLLSAQGGIAMSNGESTPVEPSADGVMGTPARSDIGLRPLFVDARSGSAGLSLPTSHSMPVLAESSLFGFAGLTGVESHALILNPDVEPPDQALAVNDSQVFEAVNDAVALYDKTSGNPLAAPISLNGFFGLPPEGSLNGSAYGPFLSDPRALYDTDTQRWFVTAIEVNTDPNSGNLLPESTLLIAVSTSADARQPFNVFAIDLTDYGFGTCPCLGDHPNVATSPDGLFVATNEYSFTDNTFQTALIVALDKYRLAAGVASPVVGFQDLGAYAPGAYALMPAQSAPGDLSSNGTEYFLSSADQISSGNAGGVNDAMTVWALSNTASLANTPRLTLQATTISTETYMQPVSAKQKSGSTPLRDYLQGLCISPCTGTEPFEVLDQDDDRIQQVSMAQGTLYSVLSTSVFTFGGRVPTSGVAWFSIKPTVTGGLLSALVKGQGYLAAENGSLLYPAVAVNATGRGAIAFSMESESLFPGLGYVPIANGQVGSSIQVATVGLLPEDGFTGYALPLNGTISFIPPGLGTARWGDYSAATIDPQGDIWFAGEYIPNITRPPMAYTNWGTYISNLKTN
jgi:hypothetical protein